jgi:hypothetical protein
VRAEASQDRRMWSQPETTGKAGAERDPPSRLQLLPPILEHDRYQNDGIGLELTSVYAEIYS